MNKRPIEAIDYWTKRLEETMEGCEEFRTAMGDALIAKLTVQQGVTLRDDLTCIKVQLEYLRASVDRQLNKKMFWQRLLRK